MTDTELAATLLAAYDAQMRAVQPVPASGVGYEHDGPLLRVVGQHRGFVTGPHDWGGLCDAELDAVIARQRDFFAARGEAVDCELWAVQLAPVRESCGDLHAPINADDPARARCVDRAGDDRKRDVPLAVLQPDADPLRRGEFGAGQAELHPAAARYLHLSPAPVESLHHHGSAHNLFARLRVHPRRAIVAELCDAVGADDTEALVTEFPAPGSARRTRR
ncbi:hypothetical protein [Streptomyces sp. Ag109_O5-1]|uniref:hypothetical protein n=1 Tax=Streptomyces sp. Ag109_O5-1 TaxID=1938851 RepID=UPI0021A2F966|nr:hypothetical protein [Streptomyces sp. Ag109_O5-1]